MPTKTLAFDAAALLDTPEAQAEYLTAALESADAAIVADALGVVARAHGMTRMARDTGLRREGLYKSLGTGSNPEFATILRVVAALGLRLAVVPGEAGPG